MDNEVSLVKLIKLAQGDRTQNQFAMYCGISSASLTRIIQNKQAPTPSALKKIASKACNGITYEQLMQAAGHLEVSEISIETLEIDCLYNSLTPQEKIQAKAYMERMIEVREEAENNSKKRAIKHG